MNLTDLSNKNIIEFLNLEAQNINESHLDWVVEESLNFFDDKISKLANKAYGVSDQISKSSFKEQSKEELKKAICTFLFTHKHYLSGRDIHSYLLTVLNRLSDRIRWDITSAKKINIPICPGCKHLGFKEFLHTENKSLRCQRCTLEFDRINEEILQCKKMNLNYSRLENNLNILKAFSLHSKKGFKCPDCTKFIPASLLNNNNTISCPYNDCFYFGDISNLENMSHPLGLSIRNDISLSSPIKSLKNNSSDGDASSLENLIKNDQVDVDTEISIKQEYVKEYQILLDVIKNQMTRLKSKNTSSTFLQKYLMYEAYLKMLYNFPEEMISYLVHLKQCTEFPIQSKIFQEYVKLIEDRMPISLMKGNERIDILSLTDPNLCLFTGLSKFNAVVDKNNCIPNNTIETYTGGRKMKYRGPCFLGKVLDIKDTEKNISIIHNMKQHSFVQIEMDKNIEPGALVEVTHFRILPHYEIGSLVYLQRIRRKIVDSVYLRIHGKKREVTRGPKVKNS